MGCTLPPAEYDGSICAEAAMRLLATITAATISVATSPPSGMQSISTNASVGLKNKDYCRLSQASVLLYQRRPLANDSELVCLRVINRFVLAFQVT